MANRPRTAPARPRNDGINGVKPGGMTNGHVTSQDDLMIDEGLIEGEDDDDFNKGFILPPLIVQLKKILDQYPEDTQILKELIQNAEDAGATVIKFFYDHHSYGTDPQQLHCPALANFQGPALYAYNDGLFDDYDWKGIRMLSQSVKANDPLKVGYFGMGFKSVFHITDLPSVISGDRLGMIEPLQQVFSASSYGWNISKNRNLLSTIRHQLDPFIGLFDCTEQCFEQGYYKGTIFRFPLRTKPSALSKNPYSSEKMHAMFEAFELDAHLQLIFLRNLERIEVYERLRDEADPVLKFRVELGEGCRDEVRKIRQTFVKQTQSKDWLDKPIVCSLRLTLDAQVFGSYGKRNKSDKDNSTPSRTLPSHSYLVTSYYCGGQLSAVFSSLHKDSDLNYLPWAGTAMAIHSSTDNCSSPVNGETNGLTNGDMSHSDKDLEDGQLFCFLPLPADGNSHTGLPVHVNGFFALEQNRKYVKWPAPGYNKREDLMDKRLLWNQCMLKEALPNAYTNMILEAIRIHGREGESGRVGYGQVTVQDVYDAFPDFDKVDKKWECVLPIMFAELFKHPTVYSTVILESSAADLRNGTWVLAKEAVFNTLDRESEEAYDIIHTVLAESHSIKVVNAPKHVLRTIVKCCHINVCYVTPTVVANAYRTCGQDGGSGVCLHWDGKIKLLRYFLRQPKLELLDELDLLPLASGGFTSFCYNAKHADKPVYVALSDDVRSLLIGLEDDFLDPELDKDIKKMLIKASSKGFTQLKAVDPNLLAELIPQCLPKNWLSTTSPDGSVEWIPGAPGHPPHGWLENLWQYLVHNSPKDLSSVEALPIVPAKTVVKKKKIKDVEEDYEVIELVPLKARGVSIARRADGISLGPQLEGIAVKLGITVVDDLPDYVKLHPLISRSYVFSSSYIGVLGAILRLCEMNGMSETMTKLNDVTDTDDKKCLREVFAKFSSFELLSDQLDLLTHMPLFETLEGSGGGKASHFVSAAKYNLASILSNIQETESSLLYIKSKVSIAAPVEKPCFPLSRLLIDLTCTTSQTLARLLNVKQLTLPQLLTQVVFRDIEDAFYMYEEVQTVMTYVLRHYQQFAADDSEFRSTLKTLAFLERSGTLNPVDRFYDPDNELLRRVFALEDRFPSGPYAESSVLAVLRGIGLRGVECVDVEDLRESAMVIQELVESAETQENVDTEQQKKLLDKSSALLEYIHRYHNKLFKTSKQHLSLPPTEGSTDPPPVPEVCQALTKLKWVQRATDRPPFYPTSVPFHSPTSSKSAAMPFDCPSSMTSRRHANLVGSVRSIVSADVSQEVDRLFGWDVKPTLEDVVKHLANVVQAYNPSEKVLFSEAVRCIYNEFSTSDLDELRTLLDTHIPSHCWLWYGDGFTSPDRLVFTPPFMDLQPYVRSMPQELLPYHTMFELFGVQRACNLTDVLKMIKSKHDDSTSTCAVEKDGGSVAVTTTQFSAVEVKRDLHICVSILNDLKGHVTGEGEGAELEELQKHLYLPIHDVSQGVLKMAPLSDCTYCDEEWIRQGYSSTDFQSVDDGEGSTNFYLVHPNVPISTSEALGVPTLMSRMLDAEELDISFGQSDSLTHRLNTLLLEYADGFAVPKELIQNADDAGATEVRFLYDERENSDARSCLIDEGMKECQGPAIWVYNNAVFTDMDFENITKLSGATKDSQTDKIGRFGLGFNAVYNLTDVPSFVSRHSVVIFDPHTTHLGKSIRNKLKPGIRIDLRRHRKNLKRLGNQFRPYTGVFGCDLRPESELDSYQGTLFRLPLRTAQQAERSEICKKHYDKHEVMELMRMLMNAGESLLLFTQNVTTITIHHIPRAHAVSPGEPLVAPDLLQIFSITKKPLRLIRELSPLVPLSQQGEGAEGAGLGAHCATLRSSTLVMSRLRASGATSAQKLPSCSLLVEVEEIVSGKGGDLTEGRKGGVGRWLLVGHMGGGESLRMALQEDNLLPTVGLAVSLEACEDGNITNQRKGSTGQSGTLQWILKYFSYIPRSLTDRTSSSSSDVAGGGCVFSYMPLPIRSGLPVHINGSFAVSSNRKHLCQPNEDDKFDLRPVWNRLLMQDGLCQAYLNALTDLCALLPKGQASSSYLFHTLWPNPHDVSPLCEPLLRAFYREITTGVDSSPRWRLFSDGNHWTDIRHTMFLDFNYSSGPVGQEAASVFKHCVDVAQQKSGDEVADEQSAAEKEGGEEGRGREIVVSLPEWMKESFEVSEVLDNLISNTYDVIKFFRQYFLKYISTVDEEKRNKILLDALKRNDQSLNQVISECECIPACPDGQTLRATFQLIDPTSFLSNLFLQSDQRFPHNSYASPEILAVLREMGIKSETGHMSWEELLERASHISTLDPDQLHVTQAQIKQLITGLLNVMFNKLHDGDTVENKRAVRFVQDKFCDTAFLPALKKPKDFPLQWFIRSDSDETSEQTKEDKENDLLILMRSCDLYSANHRDLICCVRAVADLTVFPQDSKTLQDFLRLSSDLKEPEVEDVLDQIDVLISTTNETLISSKAGQDIQKMLTQCCHFLQNQLTDLKSRKLIKERLSNAKFILNNNVLLYPRQVAFTFPHNCSPYMYGLTEYHRCNFTPLLQLVGVKDQFGTEDYVQVLQDIHDKHGSESLSKDTLKLTLHLVNLLNDCMCEQGITLNDVVKANGSIFIPDSQGALRSAAGLCYNEPECDWVPTDQSENFSHHLIPYSISKQLGVNTSRQEVLSKHSRGIAFGQKERLTARIKRILTGYPCDKEILKEMLQNADDAGASLIHFVKDPRTHGSERVFDKSWKPLQGPALCVYNDQPFSEDDIEGIQRLGEGSKAADPNKTGQYGVGFNCVYHLTDAPSFLTGGRAPAGETLCVFDPHARFVPGASKDEPGRRFGEVDKLRTIFTDIFPCYLEDKFDISRGTMFRLPLRDEAMANESELSDTTISGHTIDNLFSKFRQDVIDCLLFVNSVQSIALSEIEHLSGRLINTYRVDVNISESDRAARQKFCEYLRDVSARVKDGSMSVTDIKVMEISYDITLRDSNDYWEKWHIVQRVGFDKDSLTDIHPSILEAFRRKLLALLPRGGVAAMFDCSDSRLAMKRTRKISCFLPLPVRCDLPVNINGHFALDHESRRNLWPDDENGSGQPQVEWNKLLLTEVISRAYVTLLCAMSRVLTDNILQHSSSSISSSEMSETGSMMSVDFFCQLFPSVRTHTQQTADVEPESLQALHSVKDYWTILAESVYRHIDREQVKVLPVVKRSVVKTQETKDRRLSTTDDTPSISFSIEWLSTRGEGMMKGYYDNLNETFGEVEEVVPVTGGASLRRIMKNLLSNAARVERGEARADVLRGVLKSVGLKILTVPSRVYESFAASGISIDQVSPSTVVDHLRSVASAKPTHNSTSDHLLNKLPADLSTTALRDEKTVRVLIEYCLQDSEYLHSNLEGLPLLLTQDNRVSVFTRSAPVYVSHYQDILPGLEHRFLHSSLVDTLLSHVDSSSDAGIFLSLDVASFSQLLPLIIRESTYKLSDKRVAFQPIKDQQKDEPPASPSTRAQGEFKPNPLWLSKVWTFISDEFHRAVELQKKPVKPGDEMNKELGEETEANVSVEEVEKLDERQLLMKLIEPVKDWCLIPTVVIQSDRKSRSSASDTPMSPGGSTDAEPLYHLVPVQMGCAVLDYGRSGIMTQGVRMCLRKLGAMELCREFVDINHSCGGSSRVPHTNTNSSFLRLIVTSLEDPKMVLRAIDHTVRNTCGQEMSETIERQGLVRDECLIMLKYFNDSMSEWEDNSDSRTLLRSAPVHISVQGEVTSLADHMVFILNDDIPRCNMDAWQSRCGIIFLQCNPALIKLYETLNCHSISVARLYLDFIFVNFDYLTVEDRQAHLEFLRDVYLGRARQEEKAKVVEALTTLEFVPGNDGVLRPASAYYDRYHPVFKEMFSAVAGQEEDSTVFPAEPYSDYRWLEFLRVAGLQSHITDDMFVSFAEELASEAMSGKSNERTVQKCRILVIHLFKVKDVTSSDLLERLSEIRFLPASKGSSMYHKLHQPYGASTESNNVTYIAFKEGIPECHEALVWTSSYLLPDWANPYKLTDNDVTFTMKESSNPLQEFTSYQRAIGRMLGVKERACVDLVVEHVKHLCGTNGTVQNGADLNGEEEGGQDFKAYLRMDVMKKIYHYLQVVLMEEGSLSETPLFDDVEKADDVTFKSAVTQLSNLPCVVSNFGKQFVKPRQVIIDIYDNEQIIPYLFKAPTELGEFRGLFLMLGATQSASAEQYASVLEAIQSKTNSNKLHPNELRLTLKAVHGLFTCLHKHYMNTSGSGTGQQRNVCENFKVLYLPTSTGRLSLSTDIVYNNEPTFSARLQNLDVEFLVNLADCQLSAEYDYTLLVNLLPNHLRPIMMSSIVHELMEGECYSSKSTNSVAEKLRHQICSRAFSAGLARLVRHELRQSGRGKQAQVTLDGLIQRLKRTHVHCVDQVRTYLSYKEKRLTGSELEGECYLEVEKGSASESSSDDESHLMDDWNIYINKTSTLNEDLYVSVGDVVNRMTGRLLKQYSHYIQSILSCPPHSISKVLDRLKVRPDNQGGVGGDGSKEKSSHSVLPTSGSFVPIEEHHLLREDFESFDVGEYVGYELEDELTGEPTIIYAVILKKLSTADSTKQTTADPSVSGRRDSVSKTSSRLTDSYVISVGEDRDPVTASVTELYKFHRVERITSNTSAPGDKRASRGSASEKISSENGSSESTLPASFSDFMKQVNQEHNGALVVSDKKSDVSEKCSVVTVSKKIISETSQQRKSVPDVTSLVKHESQGGSEGVKEGEVGSKEEQEQEVEYVTDEQVKDEVTEILEEAWNLPEKQRKKVIKRLLLKWHPDKNHGDEEFCTIITQHIYREIERLELGLPRAMSRDQFSESNNMSADPRNPFSGSESFQKNFYDAYKFYFEQMNQRAREHRENRERYKENFYREYPSSSSSFNNTSSSYNNNTSSSSSNGPYNRGGPSPQEARGGAGGHRSQPGPDADGSENQSFSFEVPPTFASTNPQPAQARRFLRQAQEDLWSAENDREIRTDRPAYEWACFKAHQAAEKALKAAQFFVDAVISYSHDLVVLASSLEDVKLRQLAQKLQRIVGNSAKLYNPDPIDFITIPHDDFTQQMSLDAVTVADQILQHVKELVELDSQQ